MDDPTYLLGKVAALESALDVAMSTHPEPAVLVAALSAAMSSYIPAPRPRDVRSFAEGWMAIVTPLLTDEACRRETVPTHRLSAAVLRRPRCRSPSRIDR